MHPLRQCILSLVLPLMCACQASTAAHVSLDFSQALTATTLPVGNLVVTVTADDMTPMRVTLNPNLPNATFDVPAGPKRLFEVVGTRTDTTPPTVTYWGSSQVDLPSAARVAVEIAAYPAGQFAGTMSVPNHSFPAKATLEITPLQATPGLAGAISIPVQDGNFAQPLPAGSYQLSSTVTADGKTYTLDTLSIATITPGSNLYMSLVMEEQSSATQQRSLQFSTIPSIAGSVNEAMTSFTVSIVNESGQVASDAAGVVVLELLAANGNAIPAPLTGASAATLTGITAATTVAGVATFKNLVIDTPGTYTLRAIMPKLNRVTSSAFTITNTSTASVAFNFEVTASPNAVVAGDTVQVTVSSLDSATRIATEYINTIHIQPSDLLTPAIDYTFTAADAGTHTFSFVLRTAGAATFTVTDNSGAEGVSSPIEVDPGQLAQVYLQIPNTCPSRPCTLVGDLIAADALGNPVATFNDTVNLAGSPNVTIVPASVHFVGPSRISVTITLQGSAGLVETISIGPASHQTLTTSQQIITPYSFGGIALGLDNTTCAAVASGYWKCWGDNSSSQLGRSDYLQNVGSNPNEMGSYLPLIPFPSFTVHTIGTASQIVSGNQFKCAGVNGSDGVMCWGDNTYGQLGLGDTVARPFDPNSPLVNLGETASPVAAGSNHVCAILDNDSLFCWGDNSSGQLGLGDTVNRTAPAASSVDVGSGRYVLAATAGANFTCAQLDNSQIKCWGNNSSGQLGYGDTINRGSEPNQMGDNLPAVTDGGPIAAGSNHACVQSGNDVFCWGNNSNGQLGYGDTTTRLAPNLSTPIRLGSHVPVSYGALTAGENFTCLNSTAGVLCWGNNSDGQLGLGDTLQRDAPPSQVLAIGPVTSLQAGLNHVCAVQGSSAVLCWGSNSNGQLGYGDTINRGTTAPVNAAFPEVAPD